MQDFGYFLGVKKKEKKMYAVNLKKMFNSSRKWGDS